MIYSIAYHEGYVIVNGGGRLIESSDNSSCRQVFMLNKDLVLKTGDDSQTLHEIKLLRNVKASDKQYFPQVVATGKFSWFPKKYYSWRAEEPQETAWLLVERIYPKKRRLIPSDRTTLSRLCRAYKLKDIWPGEWMAGQPSPSHGMNWFIDSKTDCPIIIDAGI